MNVLILVVALLLATSCHEVPRGKSGAPPAVPKRAVTSQPTDQVDARCERPPFLVSGPNRLPRILERTEPDISGCAGSAGSGGDPEIEAEIAINGRARNPRITKSSSPCVDAAALKAVATWRFCPGSTDSRPSEFTMRLSVRVPKPAA